MPYIAVNEGNTVETEFNGNIKKKSFKRAGSSIRRKAEKHKITHVEVHDKIYQNTKRLYVQ